ncbi:MAG: hypothetical protein RLY21_1333 [Planctomycetota bacterium]|jgi:uncharacterized phage infection (PIP) family protein YhgE
MRNLTPALLAAAISFAPAALVACSTPGYKKGDSAADTMRGADQVAASLVNSARNAQTYFASLQEGELKPLFARFEKEVDGYDSSIKRLRSSLADVRSNTNGYIASLKKTSEAISSADLKMKTDARIANISQQLSEIDGCAAHVDSIATELSKDFSDIRNFLRADLSTRGLADAAPMAKDVDAAIGRLGKAVDELKRQLADVQTAVASGA